MPNTTNDHLDNDKEELKKILTTHCKCEKEGKGLTLSNLTNHTCGSLILESEILKWHEAHTQSKLKAFAGDIEKALEGLEVDREASEKHIRSVLADEEEIDSQIWSMQIEADDRHDVLNDVAESLKAIKGKYQL